ncbi:hypothetical protein B0H14DRAFT_3608551 [Mycena olivaceomarginata]|nr:hypothetical protein B0H14DRAFT_3608551 [Mycena olivaceomarginata]
MELMAAKAKNETTKNVSGDSDVGSDVEEAGSEGSTSEDSSDSEYEEVDEEIRRKTARRLLRRKVNKKYRHLVFIGSMKAFDVSVSELPNGFTGKAKKVAQARKKKWEMSCGDWEFVDKLVKAFEVLKLCTFEFSKKSVPTITKVLPLYKLRKIHSRKPQFRIRLCAPHKALQRGFVSFSRLEVDRLQSHPRDSEKMKDTGVIPKRQKALWEGIELNEGNSRGQRTVPK